MKLTKKILAVVLSVLFVVGVFAGCSSKDANTKDTTTKASSFTMRTQLTIRTSSQLLTKLVRLSELLMKTRFTRLMFLKVRNAQRLL